MNIISLGAGVQSSTMALMAAHGEITPMPDAAIFADTETEPQAVYDWLDWLEKQLPFPVFRVGKGDLGKAGTVLTRSKVTGLLYQDHMVPMFRLHPDGKAAGMIHRQCTSKFKIDPLIKKARLIAGQKAIAEMRKNGKPPIVTQWIGISSDEVQRMKPSREDWIVHRWPLVEMQFSRGHCLEWMEKHDYPKPPRSPCVFCPYKSDDEWIEMKKNEPLDFAKAVDFESRVRDASSKNEAIVGDVFIHSSLRPLDQVEFGTINTHQVDMFGNECEGMCGV